MVPGIALIGAGKWGLNLARNFYALGKLVAICEPNRDLVREIQPRFPGVEFMDHPAPLWGDRKISGVAIATPPATHAGLAISALNRSKDVLVEKPMALCVEDGRKMIQAARQNRRILMVGHLLEYHPAVVRLRELVGEGALGSIKYLYSNRLNLGRVRLEENVLWSFAPHDLGIIMGLVGGLPARVAAWGGSWINPGIMDSTVTLLEFEEGIKAHVFVSWHHPFKEQRLVVVGSKGMALFNDGAPPGQKLLFYRQDLDEAMLKGNPPDLSGCAGQPVPIREDEPLRLECEDFIRAIKERTRPRADGQAGLGVLTVLEASQESLNRGGKPVLIDHRQSDPWAAPVTPAAPATTRGTPPQIHPTAVIDPGCTIGEGTRIWHFTHIDKGATIGHTCNIGQNVYVAPGVTIGNNVKIQNNVSIYQGVSLGDDVFCGPSAVFTNVLIPRSHHPRRGEYVATTVGRGATIGANSTIVCGNTIGRYGFVGAGAVVVSPVPDHTLVVGNPARFKGWRCVCGEKIEFSPTDAGAGTFIGSAPKLPPGMEAPCKVCHRAYRVNQDGMVKIKSPLPGRP